MVTPLLQSSCAKMLRDLACLALSSFGMTNLLRYFRACMCEDKMRGRDMHCLWGLLCVLDVHLVTTCTP